MGKPLSTLLTKAKSALVPEDELARVIARSPRGMIPISGGFAAQFDTSPYPFASRRKGTRKWVATFASFSKGTEGTAQANCWDGPPLEARSNTRSIDPPNELTAYVVKATCPPDTRVISGGFKSSEPLNKPGPFIYESRKTGRREWTTRFMLAFMDLEFTTYAYCR
jgi:hypothetical protein